MTTAEKQSAINRFNGRSKDKKMSEISKTEIYSMTKEQNYMRGYKDGKSDVLDKIRAEIDEQYDRVHPYNISCAEGLEMALGIIDKYKAESEE